MSSAARAFHRRGPSRRVHGREMKFRGKRGWNKFSLTVTGGLGCSRGAGQFICVLVESFALVSTMRVQILANGTCQKFNR